MIFESIVSAAILSNTIDEIARRYKICLEGMGGNIFNRQYTGIYSGVLCLNLYDILNYYDVFILFVIENNVKCLQFYIVFPNKRSSKYEVRGMSFNFAKGKLCSATTRTHRNTLTYMYVCFIYIPQYTNI
jgi:hypothetical protein